MGNVCVVLVIVPFLGSISGAPALFGIARIRDERNSPHVIFVDVTRNSYDRPVTAGGTVGWYRRPSRNLTVEAA